MISTNDTFAFFFVLFLFIVIFYFCIRIFFRLKRGGGSMTTLALGSTDEFLNKDRLRAAETIVNENAGKKFDSITTGEEDKQPE